MYISRVHGFVNDSDFHFQHAVEIGVPLEAVNPVARRQTGITATNAGVVSGQVVHRGQARRPAGGCITFLSGADEGKGFSLGFADALITMLGRLDDVTVLPTSAILNYAAGTDPARACRDLGTRHLLQGNVQKLGAHWRVSMHLFDAMTQKSISSEHHDFDLENVFDVQDEIGRLVVESLRKRFPPTVPKSRDRYSSDPEAYTEFMAGLRDSYSDRSETLESAIQHLSTAVERDPEFALAHAWLSYVLTNVHFTFDPRPARLEKAEHHCRRALMLDPVLPEGHLARAFILWSPAKNFQHAEALEALEQVLAVQPNLEQAHNRIASICMHIGRLQEARIAHEQAQRSNPKTRSGNLEWFFLSSGDFARAEELAEAWIRERPGAKYALYFHPQPPLMIGDLDLAGERLAMALEHFPDEPLITTLQGICTRVAIRPTWRSNVFAGAGIAAFLRPHAPHLLPSRLYVCSAWRTGQGDGMARTHRRHRQCVLALLQDRPTPRIPA